MEPSSRTRLFFLLLALDAAIMLADAFFFGLGHVDTPTYVDQIIGFRHLQFATSADAWDAYRAFKPLYGVLSLVLSFLSPVAVLFVVNAAFLVGLTFVAHAFFVRMKFSPQDSLLGTFWVMTAYPALGLGFAAGTDISGWFFCFVTIVVALKAIEEKSDRLLTLASLLGFLGALSKETGVLGLVFAGVYLLFLWPSRGWKQTLKSLAALSLPFIALEGFLFYLIARAGFPTFFGWVSYNENLYSNIYTFKYFFGAELATFNLLWIPIAIGLYALLRGAADKDRVLRIVALAIAAAPVLIWPTFTDRILYIECIALVPIALYGAAKIRTWSAERIRAGLITLSLYTLPLAAAACLVLINGHDGLYRLFDYLFKTHA